MGEPPKSQVGAAAADKRHMQPFASVRPAARTAVWPPRAFRGFTLIELMLAMSVVAVLMGVTMTTWRGWNDRAKVTKAQQDIISVSPMIDQHLLDTGELPADLAAVGQANLRDPWGNAYEYLPLTTPAARGHARKDHSLVPLNSDYDLYSKGPDGRSSPPLTASASRDDILRANNGRFVGPARSY